jgi:UDP-glucose 4-epimerase
MSKVLVTGGAGFIGSNIVEALVEEGHGVTVLDNFSLGTEKNLSNAIKQVKIIRGDIRDRELLLKITKNMDFIFTEAAASASPMFRERLAECIDINVNGFVNILQAAKENNVRRVIYASTSSVYANNPPPLKEDMKVTPPNFYSVTKLANEHTALLFGQEYDLETVGLRYMSIYGPKEESKGHFANLASQFLWTMQKGEQPVIYGDGSQTRDFTFVKDAVKANILAMKSKKRLIGEFFNVGSGKAVDLNKLVGIINKLLGKSLKPKYVKIPVKNYINTQLGDLTKINRTLGYKPDYTLERGLVEMINMQK